ncbi:hypothetical protein MWH28_04605 [Natroniella sulfidigena]|uniref:hypothetical protein n=1 Tax=Natroniella sulfidigena TaxID=723921 RepID=UPI002009EFA1|nr:hypothetical protein [Natroniella sulfidigena]MCK8816651.1 hypothetical protein [Natroniella sulfidigena]
MELSLVRIILIGFPESLLLAYLGLGLVGINTDLSNYLKVGLLHTVGLIIIRGVFDIYGLHTLLLGLLLAMLLKLIVELNLQVAFAAALLGFVVLVLLEAGLYLLVINYFSFTLIEVSESLPLSYSIAYSTQLLLFLIAQASRFFEIDFSDLAGEEHA